MIPGANTVHYATRRIKASQLVASSREYRVNQVECAEARTRQMKDRSPCTSD